MAKKYDYLKTFLITLALVLLPLRQLAEMCARFRNKGPGSKEKDSMLVELMDANRRAVQGRERSDY